MILARMVAGGFRNRSPSGKEASSCRDANFSDVPLGDPVCKYRFRPSGVDNASISGSR